MKREDVYKLIDEEREYQNSKDYRPKSDDEWTVAEWLNFIRHQLLGAEESIYYLDEEEALVYVRKIAGLCVACMEYNDTKSRLENNT